MSGLNASNALVYQPSINPAGTPITAARVNPQVTRKSEAAIYFSKRPFSPSSTMPRRTSIGLGNKSLWENLTAISQTTRNSRPTVSGRINLMSENDGVNDLGG